MGTSNNILVQLGQMDTGDALTGLGGGDGQKRDIDLNPIADLRTAAGLVLTGATAPSVQALETNALGVQVAAGATAAGSYVFDIPQDYDPSQRPAGAVTTPAAAAGDFFQIHVKAISGGTTNAPTLNATIYSSRSGKALGSALTTQASQAINKSTAHPATVVIDVSGNKLLPGDTLTVNLTTAAHATDAVNIYSVRMVYMGHLVVTNMAIRST